MNSDPVTFASVAALLVAVALAACYVPARRPVKADVVGLLRWDPAGSRKVILRGHLVWK
jgi:hypothetical protein